MEITEVRIKLMDDPGERLQAFCSITFDDAFVVRDLKIIDGTNGSFVAMPSRKLTAHCAHCRYKNHLRAAYCNQCGSKLHEVRPAKDDEGRAKLYADIAHPINSACREMIQERVIREYALEKERAKLPGYVSRYDEFDREDFVVPATPAAGQPGPQRPPRTAADRPAAERAPVELRPGEVNTPHPAGPHRGMAPAATPHQRTAHSAPAVPAPATPSTAGPSPQEPPPGSPPSGPGPKRDGFGAGIF